MDPRSHYPQNCDRTNPAWVGVLADSPQDHLPVLFYYQIEQSFSRKHHNPPVWTQPHYHQFRVRLSLAAVKVPSNLYGLDMVEVEQMLRNHIEQLPDSINRHPDCPHGTTEELCAYFANIKLPEPIALTEVAVAECPERWTIITPDSFAVALKSDADQPS